MSASGSIVGDCVYPQSNATGRRIEDELQGLVEHRDDVARFYLDTKEEHHNPGVTLFGQDFGHSEGEDHHQGLARSHRLSDGSIWWFLTHSEMDPGDRGQLMHFRFAGPVVGNHVVETAPLTVAPMVGQLYLVEQHPCDICFFPDVNAADAGYLFVCEQHNTRTVAVYAWDPARPDLTRLGAIDPGFAPQWVFFDRIDDSYHLGIATDGQTARYTARADKLFADCVVGGMNVDALLPAGPFDMPDMEGASQVKLVRDVTGAWSLLGYRSDSDGEHDDPNGDDWIDVYPVMNGPTFAIGPRSSSTHVYLRPGDTGFASDGTHHVDDAGTLLVSSSWRWSDNPDDAGDFGYVSRVDEVPSAINIVIE